MTLKASELFNRLTELDSDDDNPFTLATDVAESDVQTWYDGIDIQALETEIDNEIDRTTVTDLSEPQGIGGGDLSVADVIKSRDDDPSEYDAAYLIRSDKTIVQYFKPRVGGREPIPASDVDNWMSDHVAEMVERAVNAELLPRAKTEFGA